MNLTATNLCKHIGPDVNPTPTPGTPNGCQECLATGGRWVHLRLCLACGHVGCCDNSPGQHATAHFHQTEHPLIRSYEPGEDWWWCYLDDVFLDIPDAPPALSHS